MDHKMVQTVLGSIEPSKLGITLPHEHLSIDFDKMYIPPNADEVAGIQNCSWELANVGWIRQNPYCHKDNLTLKNCEAIIEKELQIYKAIGGSSIVELSTHGLQRNLKFIKDISESTGVHIITGAGYYVNTCQELKMNTTPVEELTESIMNELTVGSDGIRCGCIGELGCSFPLHANERRVLQAGAIAQSQAGCGMNIHPGRDVNAPIDIIRILQESGADISKTTMSHLDRTIADNEKLIELAETGCYLEYDLFGIEVSKYVYNPKFDMPSDAERIKQIKFLVDEGHEDKILIAHDIHTKHRLVAFGGHGFNHIQKNVVPTMLDRGLTQKHVDKFLIHNPAAWLTVK
ncbi:N-acetyltaurine hydrolase-like [Tubulanus polymorphus]|uniref:N-acetyltaurine hydrolase-like n=1 Tax=Tubulanus polymorphus TaxID=672921 RepID=UPI003DA56A74